ncbi:hypothetical protein NLG42_21355 [Flavobacterium plurextorum]|uniref:hypothetical protein n=1 Tax=Flavobacterium TaxID=237 RepID=UPI00214DCD2F|nr:MULTISPECIES: hypothetical protein [Flavobacterium]UUW08638.1 hypothetical protein NLG42_21355 [Flavobacterium plurextorum]
MFTNITWSSYLTAACILTIVWYLIILFKFYRTDLKKIFSGEKKFRVLSFKKSSKNLRETKSISDSFQKSFGTLEDAEALSARIVSAVRESVEKNLSKQQFENYLRMLLEQYPYVKISSLKENINQKMVSESEKHPKLQLTLSEADSLWEGSLF